MINYEFDGRKKLVHLKKVPELILFHISNQEWNDKGILVTKASLSNQISIFDQKFPTPFKDSDIT